MFGAGSPTIFYPARYDSGLVPGGFTTPTWEGYPSQAVAAVPDDGDGNGGGGGGPTSGAATGLAFTGVALSPWVGGGAIALVFAGLALVVARRPRSRRRNP
jgi:hypothetical protein